MPHMEKVNQLRAKYELEQGMNLMAKQLETRVIVPVAPGFDYARAVSPLTHFVGFMHYDDEPKLNKTDEELKEWLNSIPSHQFVIYAAFGTETYPQPR